jgi:hypothetical protein
MHLHGVLIFTTTFDRSSTIVFIAITVVARRNRRPRCIESTYCGFAHRQGATLVAVHGHELLGSIGIEWICVKNLIPRLANPSENHLRLSYPTRERQQFRAGALARNPLRQVFSVGRKQNV